MSRGMTTFVTMAVLVAVLVGGTYAGVRLLFSQAPALPEADNASCRNRTLEPGEQLATNQVQVNVLNAGGRSGLANRTMINLQSRGFVPGQIGNVPSDSKAAPVKNVTVISREPSRVDSRLVGAQFRGKVKYERGTPDDESGVEVHIGPKFEGLRKKQITSLKASKKVTICVPLVGGTAPAS